MKKAILLIVIVIIIALIGFFAYVSRPVSAPTQDIQSATGTLNPVSNITSVYRVSQDASKAEFHINELLSGKPKLVIGTTNQLAGDIAITNSHIDTGQLKINARTWKTDSSSRDGAIDRLILKAEDPANEFIVFQPTENDFKGTIVPGKDFTFGIKGNLTVSGVTKPATFSVTAKIEGDTLTGTAQTKIKRSDFNLNIPNFPFLANVDDEFPVIVTITANKVNQ